VRRTWLHAGRVVALGLLLGVVLYVGYLGLGMLS
jgi:hypothetical protein